MRPRFPAAALFGAAMAGPALLLPQPAAAQYVPPPVMPVPEAWQGKAQAVVRVLSKLDSRTQVLTLAVGETGSVGSLQVTPRSCLVRPDGLPRDAASLLLVRDAKGTTTDFSGWMFASEPSLDVFESPVYGVQLVGCGGADVAPAAPALPPPAPAPSWMEPPAVVAPSAPDDNGDAAGTEQPPPAGGDAGAAPGPDAFPPAGNPPPDAVYPDGQPMPDPSGTAQPPQS